MTLLLKYKARWLIFSPYYPPHAGGLESHSHQFNEEARRRGYHITVFTPLTESGGLPDESPQPGLRIRRFPAFELIPNYPMPNFLNPSFWRLLKISLSPRPDLIISRTRFFSTSLLALVVAKLINCPLLHIEHGSDFVHLYHPLLSKFAYYYDQTFGRFILRKATFVSSISQATSRFVYRLSKRTTPVIYRGIDHAMISAAPAKPLPRNKINLIYAGRLISGKGVADLLQALFQVSEQSTTSFHCYIAGSGPEEKSLKRLAHRLGINGHLTWLSKLPRSEVISYFKSCDIFINPSYTEGLPTSVIEAALCRMAIVATNVGGTSEILPNQASARLVVPGHPGQLANAIQELLRNPEIRHSLASTAYQHVSNRFNWGQSFSEYEKITKQTIA